MTITVLCIKIVSKNNYQIGVKAVSSGGRKFCKPIHMHTTSLGHELFRVNQTYNVLAIVACDTKNIVTVVVQKLVSQVRALNEVDKINKLIYSISST